MKKKFLAICCLLLSAGGFTASANAVLTVNGQQVQKALTHLTFDGDNVIVHYADNSTSNHDMAAAAINFDTTTGLTELTFSELTVTVGNTLEISGVAEGCLLQIFDIRGRLAGQVRSESTQCSMDISSLESGVYLLRAGNEVVKFVKR